MVHASVVLVDYTSGMRVTYLEDRPFHVISYLNAARGGGTVSERLPFLRGKASGLPLGIDALIVASDLQGVAPVKPRRQNELLGIRLVQELEDLSRSQKIPELDRVGVVLTGDLYSAPGGDVRGASGDVRLVLEAFSEKVQWVVSVAGNHDRFGTKEEQEALASIKNLSMLDGDICRQGDVLFGGVSYAMGDKNKLGWVSEDIYLTTLELVLEYDPDVLLLHHCPMISQLQRGSPRIREVIENRSPSLVICGHYHWDKPMAQMAHNQVLNVDARVVVISRAK